MRLRLYLGIILAAPVSIVTGVFYVIPFWLLGWHKYLGVRSSTNTTKSGLGTGLVWYVNDDKAPKWLLDRWNGWAGHCVGSTVVLRHDPSTLEGSRGQTYLNHELHHAHQMHTLGFLQPFLYAISSGTAWIAGEPAYTGNHFEVAARRAAGQIVDAQSFAQGYAWCRSHK